MSISSPPATETKKCFDLARNLLAPFTCHICSFRSCEKMNLQRHFLNKHSLAKKNLKLTFPCTSCGRVFKGKTYLQTHLLGHHSEELVTKPYRCSECSSAFSTILELESHHLTHEYDLTSDPNDYGQNEERKQKRPLLHCNKCSLGFESEEHLSRHQRRHIETISSSEDHIRSLAKQKNSRSAHNRTATSKQKLTLIKKNASKIKAKYERSKKKKREKQQKHDDKLRNDNSKDNDMLYCPYCPSQFSNRHGVGTANLNIHVVLKHKDTVNETNPSTSLQKCPLCVKLFISKRSLKTHVCKKHELTEETVLLRFPSLCDAEEENTTSASNTNAIIASTNTKQPLQLNFKQRKRENNSIMRRSNSDLTIAKNDRERSLSPHKLVSASSMLSSTTTTSETATVRPPPHTRKPTAAQERKARLKERIRKRRAMFKTQVTTTTSTREKRNTGVAVSTVVSAPDDVDSALSSGQQQKRGRGRPPGTTKNMPGITGRIAKKYRCPHCHLTYITTRRFNTHKKICKFKFQRTPSSNTTKQRGLRNNFLKIETELKE